MDEKKWLYDFRVAYKVKVIQGIRKNSPSGFAVKVDKKYE